MGDWMISKKRFWGLALPIWKFEDGSFYVVGSREELKNLAVEGWEEFEGHSPHRPWIDKVKIKHPDTGLVGTRIEDVGNPWLDAGIVPYSTLNYNKDKSYWEKWFPADFVVECFPGQFRNWFYSLLAMSTTMEGKAPFKTLLGHALVKDETGRDMHKSWGNAIWFDDAAEKMGVDTMRWLYASQNTEHNLLFGYQIADEVRKNLITLWNTYSFFTTYANLDGFDPSKYSLDKIKLSTLDKWMIAKMNDFIELSDSLYDKFELFRLMKESTKLLDDISNWYVRRNRRRFWKSENDEDKIGAYLTLYSTLINYLKIMAPVIPFVTDKIYENLILSVNSKSPSSIHLTDFPKVNNISINKDLVSSIDMIKEIVNLGRSARNKSNLKIRQPLSDIIIFISDLQNELVEKNKQQIIEELNVKNVIFIKDEKKIVNYELKPNFNILGQKYGKNMKEIVSLLKDVNVEDFKNQMSSNDKFLLADGKFEILKDDINIVEHGNEGYSLSSGKNIIVSLNTQLTRSLKDEGSVRDLIRTVQNSRKELGFEVEDRITISINCSDSFNNALNNNLDYFKNETLCESLFRDKSNNIGNYEKININSEIVHLIIKRV
jgi:isoleucyl-tRNA synthetase